MDEIYLNHYDVRYDPSTNSYMVTTADPSGHYDIDPENYSEFQEAYEQEEKSRVVMMVLWLILGLLGFHRFYVGDTKIGFIMMFTLGGFVVGWLLDFIHICPRVTEYNEELKKRLLIQAILRAQRAREAS